MRLKQYVVDAFTDKVFCGNPAALCVLDDWISDELMMNITKENRYSETAFAVKDGAGYRLRWFTPGGEIDLCGHATLGMAYVIMNVYDKAAESVTFDTLSGRLFVRKNGALYEMRFPAYTLRRTEITEQMTDALGAKPVEAWLGRDLLCVFESEEAVKNLKPDLKKVKGLDGLLLHATAKGNKIGNEYDCVSRTFAPKCDVDEDPVCGSGHCHIIPYWAGKTGKSEFVAYQASSRGGVLYCRMDADNGQIYMSGKACLFAESTLYV